MDPPFLCSLYLAEEPGSPRPRLVFSVIAAVCFIRNSISSLNGYHCAEDGVY